MNSKYSFKSTHFQIQMRFKLKKIHFKNMHCFQNYCHSIYYRLICWFYSLMWFIMILNHLKADHVQPKIPLFTSDSQHPPRFRHAVYLSVEWFSGKEENDLRNYFMINLHESMEQGRDRTGHPWICSQTPKTRICYQTCYQLHYPAR